MNEWERAASPAITRSTEQLALYDRYGSMAYGIILQIIPQTQLAQDVLVDLFSSPDLQSSINAPGNPALAIIRLARAKALDAKNRVSSSLPQQPEPSELTSGNVAEVVFDLSFRQGYSVDAIVTKLQLPKHEVLKAIHEYCNSNRFRRA